MADDKSSRIQLPGELQAQEYIGTHHIEDSGALTLTRGNGSVVTFGPGQWVSVEGDQTEQAAPESTPDATGGSSGVTSLANPTGNKSK